MANGISLHIGLETVSKDHYFFLKPLYGAPRDALYMQELADKSGFTSKILVNEAATRAAVMNELESAATKLQGGDIFLISYSGHGGQFKIKKYKDLHEKDGHDETWCLYDEQIIDDELYKLWTNFREGVRVLVFSDSCHSGSITRAGVVNKTIQQNLQDRILRDHLIKYTQRKKEAANPGPLHATVLSLSACEDKQEALDLGFNGAFTNAIRYSLTDARSLSYSELLLTVKENLEANNFSQKPVLKILGESDFSGEVVFSI